jgi:hypothetical protein
MFLFGSVHRGPFAFFSFGMVGVAG